MSEGGHSTDPYTDRNDMGTWITVQEGHIGSGYIVHSKHFDWTAWRKDQSYHGGRARYLILKRGQTVYFPPGTIHFFFSLPQEQSLAVRGSVLQWSEDATELLGGAEVAERTLAILKNWDNWEPDAVNPLGDEF
ncbi:Ff.00g065670.m01.CDS01 [Fusarium sp. VM40]|nr:Ff.00g065670.m01.CDS01 [Fusarium sp. VM40]